MQGLKEVIFSVTNRCNLHCRMCDIPAIRGKELPTATLKGALTAVSALGGRTVVFSGGEPFVRQDIYELIGHASQCRLEVCLTSNGMLVDDGVARRLAEAKIKVINISVEGTREVHDSLRGKGTFDKALAALGHLRRHKVESTIACTVSGHNYQCLAEVMGLAVEYGATTVLLQPFSPIFLRPRSRVEGFYLRPAQKKELEGIIEEYISLAEKAKVHTNPAPYLRSIPGYLAGEPLAVQHVCEVLWSSCAINAQGDVLACWSYAAAAKGFFSIGGSRQKPLGNIREQSLVDIWLFPEHAAARARMLRAGCKGCLMSCYGSAASPGDSPQIAGWKGILEIGQSRRLLKQELGG